MLKLKKIAVTGGIASGKTTVCRLLKKHGAYQVSADEIIHQLLESNSECKHRIIDLLGIDILTDGKIDRKKVADKVFANAEKLEKLENLLHPFLFEEIESEYQKVKDNPDYICFVVELPLVQEIGKENVFDLIIAVVSDELLAKKRFAEAGFSNEEYERRMKRQWKPSKKGLKADYVLVNDGDMKTLELKVKEFINAQMRKHPTP